MTTPRVTVPVDGDEVTITLTGKVSDTTPGRPGWFRVTGHKFIFSATGDDAPIRISAAPAPEGWAAQWGWRVRAKPSRGASHRPWHWQADEPTETTAELCEWEPVYVSLATREEAPAEGAGEAIRAACIAWHEAIGQNPFNVLYRGAWCGSFPHQTGPERWTFTVAAMEKAIDAYLRARSSAPEAREDAQPMACLHEEGSKLPDGAISGTDDGQTVWLESSTGGAHCLGMWGGLSLRFTESDGSFTIRHYEDVNLRAQPPAREDAQPVEGRGHRHTAIMDAIHSELMRQFPGALTEEDGNATLAIHATKPFLTIDVSSLAEVALYYPAPDALRVAVEQTPDAPWIDCVQKMLDRFDRAKGKGGYPTANEREAMRRCMIPVHLLAALQAEQGAK